MCFGRRKVPKENFPTITDGVCTGSRKKPQRIDVSPVTMCESYNDVTTSTKLKKDGNFKKLIKTIRRKTKSLIDPTHAEKIHETKKKRLNIKSWTIPDNYSKSLNHQNVFTEISSKISNYEPQLGDVDTCTKFSNQLPVREHSRSRLTTGNDSGILSDSSLFSNEAPLISTNKSAIFSPIGTNILSDISTEKLTSHVEANKLPSFECPDILCDLSSDFFQLRSSEEARELCDGCSVHEVDEMDIQETLSKRTFTSIYESSFSKLLENLTFVEDTNPILYSEKLAKHQGNFFDLTDKIELPKLNKLHKRKVRNLKYEKVGPVNSHAIDEVLCGDLYRMENDHRKLFSNLCPYTMTEPHTDIIPNFSKQRMMNTKLAKKAKNNKKKQILTKYSKTDLMMATHLRNCNLEQNKHCFGLINKNYGEIEQVDKLNLRSEFECTAYTKDNGVLMETPVFDENQPLMKENYGDLANALNINKKLINASHIDYHIFQRNENDGSIDNTFKYNEANNDSIPLILNPFNPQRLNSRDEDADFDVVDKKITDTRIVLSSQSDLLILQSAIPILSCSLMKTMELVQLAYQSFEINPKMDLQYFFNSKALESDLSRYSPTINIEGNSYNIAAQLYFPMISKLAKWKKRPHLIFTLLNTDTTALLFDVPASLNYLPDTVTINTMAQSVSKFGFLRPVGVAGILFMLAIGTPFLRHLPPIIFSSYHSEVTSSLVSFGTSWAFFKVIGNGDAQLRCIQPT